MVSVLQRFERRLENAVSGAFARAFRSSVQPVEIASALQREADNSAQILSRDRTLVPNEFTVELSPGDYERLAAFEGTLAQELATLLREHIDDQRYTITGAITIRFREAGELTTGRFRVRSSTQATVTPVDGQRMTESAVRTSEAVLDVNGVRHPLTAPSIVLGRGSEAELRIHDPGVSRRHAEIRVRHESRGVTVTIRDLASTNGVIVDGHKVPEATLHNGSEIRLGNTVLRVLIGSAEDA